MERVNRLFKISLFLILNVITCHSALSSTRKDHIIQRGKQTHVPGYGWVTINHDYANIYFSNYEREKPRVIRKVRGLHPSDSNRTLLDSRRSVSLYFVDTIVGAHKVQVAVIRE